MPQAARSSGNYVEIMPSATKTADGNQGTTIWVPPRNIRAIVFIADITAAATVAADTLDLYIQTQLNGVDWLDVVHFTQLAGDGGAKQFIAKIVSDAAEADFEVGSALGASAVRNLLGDAYRVRWDVTVDGTLSYTFSVIAAPM